MTNMDKGKKSAFKIILFDTVLYGALFAGLCLLLSLFQLQFRQGVYILSAGVIAVGFLAGVIQLLLKIKGKALKISLISVFILVLLLAARPILLIAAFTWNDECVVERDNKTYVAYVWSFLHTSVDYYDYYNFLVCGRQVRISEQGDGYFNRTEGEWDFPPRNVTYYDENSEILYVEE